jgi:GNAT superfamily N-acetyltransferase
MVQRNMIRIEVFAGQAIVPHLPALARLRMEVFRAWPYLYDGSLANEEKHLASFAASPRAALVVAFDGDEAVGCSSCLPLMDEDRTIAAPFVAGGFDPKRFFYFGESVLLSVYRGHGIGVAFFREREAHARRVSDCDYACFCAVQRPDDHPLRPAGAVKLDEFWRKRGFTPYPDLTCTMEWKQVDTNRKVANRLSFWIKSLTGAPLP